MSFSLISYYLDHAQDLLRPPASLLRHPFIVPGAIYANELWDWDAYWTTCGLLDLAFAVNDNSLCQKIVAHGKGCLFNFFDYQSQDGTVPIMMGSTCVDRFGCLQPCGPEVNQAKPVLGQFALRLCEASSDLEWVEPILDNLDRFYNRWETKYRSHCGLLVWGSDVGIGIDNDPTTYGRPDFSSANLLLNCLYVADLKAAAKIALQLGQKHRSKKWEKRAAEVSALVRDLCWDGRDEFFYTVDTQCHDSRLEKIPWAKPGMEMSWKVIPLKIQMFTGFLAMSFGIATPSQAAMLLKHIRNQQTFQAHYGIRSLSKAEPMYSLAPSGNPSNWLGPVWILANYLAWKGLKRYGFDSDAAALSRKTITLLERDLECSGTLHEYYDPDTGKGLQNPGFFSWNVLAIGMLSESPIHCLTPICETR